MKSYFLTAASGINAFGAYMRSHKFLAGLLIVAVLASIGLAVSAATNSTQPEATSASSSKPQNQKAAKTKSDSAKTATEVNSETPQTDAAPAATAAASSTKKPVSTPAAAAPNPQPAPTPAAPPLRGYVPPPAISEPGTFDLDLVHEAAYVDNYGQIIVPFFIIRQAGFSLAMEMPSTRVIASPPGATNIYCTAGFKDTDRGFVSIYGPDDAPAGTYGCELSIKSGFITRTDVFYFDYPE